MGIDLLNPALNEVARDGYGYGYGDGYGYGYGYGYGDGYGDGYGYGDGKPEEYVAALSIGAAGALASKFVAEGCALAIWKSNSDGKPANGGGGLVRKAGDIEELPGPLPDNCGKGALHATLNPQKWQGDRLWVVALYPPFNKQDDKLWSLKREIICEIPNFYK